MITVNREGARWVARFPFSYETKDVVKAAGFRFSAAEKLWYTTDPTVARRLDPMTAMQAVEEANAAIAQSRATNAAVAVPAPDGLAYLPYQLAGIAYAIAHANVLIADEMGLGKTIQAIGVVNATPAIKSVLVICPASLKINWAREMTKWLVRSRTIQIANGSFPQSDIVIINYDVLLKHRDAIMARQWDLMVIDECHYLKNTKAQRTKAIFGGKLQGTTLKPIPAKRRIFMTGTPIVNRPAELWSLVHALDPADLGGNFFRFMKRYTNARHNGYGWDFTGAANLSELQQRLRSKFMVRRLKKDVLKELPAKRRQILTVFGASAAAVVARELAMFEHRQAAVATAQAAVEKAEAAGDQEAYKAAVARLKNMKQIDFAEMSKLRHETAVAKIPHVVEHVTEVLEAEEKVVVFVHHHDVAHALKAAFPTAAVVTGETTVGQRQLEVDRFQIDPDCRVFIGSIKAAGLGLTLTAASHVVFAELDWVPGAVSQAEDRLHRIGQVNSVLVQHLVFDNSVDSRMAHMLVEKQNVIDAALDNPVNKVVLSEALASLI